jgi:hypothetical protein
MKERLFCNGLSQEMKHGCTTMNLQANVKAWTGNSYCPELRDSEVSFASKVILMLF